MFYAVVEMFNTYKEVKYESELRFVTHMSHHKSVLEKYDGKRVVLL